MDEPIEVGRSFSVKSDTDHVNRDAESVLSLSHPFPPSTSYITAIYISVFRVSSFIRKSTLDDRVASSFALDRIQIRESSLARARFMARWI